MVALTGGSYMLDQLLIYGEHVTWTDDKPRFTPKFLLSQAATMLPAKMCREKLTINKGADSRARIPQSRCQRRFPGRWGASQINDFVGGHS